MQDKEIILKWLSGLSKEQLAKQYKRQYNMQIKIIRAEVRNRHSRKIYNAVWGFKLCRKDNL